MRNWQGQRIVIVGAARQGTALARYLAQHGAQVVINDARPMVELEAARQALGDLPADQITWVAGGHPLSILDGADWLCLSGGVSPDLPLATAARQRGLPLTNDSQIFLETVACPTIGITGSAGKTTTTTLVGRMATAASESPVYVGGNIGLPLISLVDEMRPTDLAVLELSSFQLELMTLSTSIAAILNITPNHLDRHGTMEAYTAAKAHILDYQQPGSAAVLGRDDPGAWALAQGVKGRLLSFGLSPLPAGHEGTYLRGNELYLRQVQPSGKYHDLPLMPRELIELRGEHNLLNVLAACAITAAAGFSAAAMQAGVRNFRGVAHRIEFVRSWGGAKWYNDSKATTPKESLAAIRSFDEPLVLLAGGRDKKLPWEEFAALVYQRVNHLILFGEAADKIALALAKYSAETNQPGALRVTRVAGLHDAVLAAAGVVEPGNVVLLSPGGTSFDEFRDFEERGKCFIQWVNELP